MMQQRSNGPMRGPAGAMLNAQGEKVQDFKGTMKKLIAYLGGYRTAILIVFVFAIASTAANIAGPKILGEATTKLFEGVIAQINGTGTIDMDALWCMARATYCRKHRKEWKRNSSC